MKPILSSIAFALLALTLQAQSPHNLIKAKLKELKALEGEWAVETQMLSKDGSAIKEHGEYKIAWALDSTYLEWTARLKNSINGRSRQFVCWLTYDTEKSKYREIYIYDRMSFMVIEFGDYDNKSKTLRTTTTLNLPQGEENLRTECVQLDQDHFEFKSWSRFGDEKEFNDFNASMRRK